MRVNVYLPDELIEAVRHTAPALNMSRTLQEALRDVLKCEHRRLCCARCAATVDHRQLIDDALGTAEGAARVVKSVAMYRGITRAKTLPLPRPSRAQRHRQRVLEFPETNTTHTKETA